MAVVAVVVETALPAESSTGPECIGCVAEEVVLNIKVQLLLDMRLLVESI